MTQYRAELKCTTFVPSAKAYNPFAEARSTHQLFMQKCRAERVFVSEAAKRNVWNAFEAYFIRRRIDANELRSLLRQTGVGSVEIDDLVPSTVSPDLKTPPPSPQYRQHQQQQPPTPTPPRIVTVRTSCAVRGLRPKAIGSERHVRNKKT